MQKKLQFLFLMIFYGQTRNASEQYTFIYVLYYWWTKRDIQKWNSIKVKLFGLNTYPTSNLTIYRQLCLDMIWIVILKRVDLLLHQKNHFILLNVHRYLCRKCIKNGNWLKQYYIAVALSQVILHISLNIFTPRWKIVERLSRRKPWLYIACFFRLTKPLQKNLKFLH